MYEYTTFHLKFEEEFMEKIKYPARIEHKKKHRIIDSSIYDYYRKIGHGDYVSDRHIFKLLQQWISDHILIEDWKLADYIHKNNIDYKKMI